MIELTLSDSKQTIWINPKQIVYVCKSGSGAIFELTSGMEFPVHETPEEILEKIHLASILS